MATYDMTKEMTGIIEITHETVEGLRKRLNLYQHGEGMEAWNRREQNKITMELNTVTYRNKKAIERAAYENKIENGVATWKRYEGEWCVLINNGKLTKDTVVKVTRKDGSISEAVIKYAKVAIESGTIYSVATI